MADSQGDDIVWRTAVEWIIRKHESPLDVVAEKELASWLEKDRAHRAAYEEATQLWLLTGLIPRSEESGPES
jgi:transmembrane sensor